MILARAIVVIVFILFSPVFFSNRVFAQKSSCQRLEASLQTLIDRATQTGFPGISLAFYKPSCGMVKLTSGLSNLKSRKKMTPSDKFRLASCSKAYIGVVIMQLVEEGKLSLDDPISKYIPQEYTLNIKNANKATVRQLMNHTSGMYDYFDSDFTAVASANRGKLYRIDEALRFAYGKEPEFSTPGKGYHYSNTNTVLLGAIIEKVSGSSYSQALRKRIFEPLNLKETYNDYIDPVIEPLARGYFLDRAGKRVDYTEINQGYGLPDGVVVSSAQDMVTFLRALLRQEKLLKSETVGQMLVVDEAAKRFQDGLNLFVYSDYRNGSYGKMVGHDGEYGGYKSEMFYFPDKDVAVVLLTNISGSRLHSRWKRLYDEVTVRVLRMVL
ncbi:MAG: beta-lactamase family protein [Blastocatellia bacterium]|nr:beta-lactamase family protein [Blastocatellia bacterium]